MKPLGYPCKRSHKTRCEIVGRKKLCWNCLYEAKIRRNGRMKQKKINKQRSLEWIEESKY